MNDEASARRFHESTKHGTPPAKPEALVDFRRLDPRNAPSPFKVYRDIAQIALPRRIVASSLPATVVLSGDRGETSRVDLAMLATILFLSAGVTRMAGPAARRMYFRSAMSAGNLHPIEVYLVTGESGVDGLDPGVYHFAPLEFALTPLREGDYRGWLGIQARLGVVLTGMPWRTTWKYGERGWRHLYWDSGTMLANLLAVADAHGLEHRIRLGFDDGAVNELLGVDGATEMPLAILDVAPDEGAEATAHLGPLIVEAAPVAASPVRLPLLQAAQSGGTLTDAEVEEWLRAGSGIARAAPSRVPVTTLSEHPIEEIILRRGSTRRMVHRQVEPDSLEWPMAAATRAVGIDVIPGGSLLDHFMNVHAVAGFAPGSYHQGETGLDQVRDLESVRDQSAALSLGQPLGGDSSYTVFHCADLDPIYESLGTRGYRVAQLEAGVVSGRLALCAFALGLGATGLTFFDDAVSQFFATRAQPMLVTSVGVPTSPPAPAGRPGSPAEIHR